jgi:pSer/pThr/pTyr-binding forkhead associated (FHA) protein
MLIRDARLRYPVRDGRGILLLARGAVVTQRLESMLRTWGISLDLRASLKALEGGASSPEIPLCKSPFKIGRRPDCDLQLASQVVSGCHCQIHQRLAGIFLEDLQSDNRTYLNGQPIPGETELSDRDILRVGPFQFTVQIYAALAADSDASTRALNAWVLEELDAHKRPVSTFGPTEPEIDLDASAG